MNPPQPSAADGTRRARGVVNYVLLIGLALAALVFLRLILISALIGIGIGVILAPVLRRAQSRYRIPRAAGAFVTLALLFGVVAGVAYSIFLITETQLASFAERLPDLVARLQQLWHETLARYPWLHLDGASLDVPGTARTLGAQLFHGAWSGFALVGALVFAVVIGLYTAVEADYYRNGLVAAFPPRQRERVQGFLARAAGTIRAWFTAQLIDMAIIGTLTSVGLWLVGAEYGLLFGILTGVLGIIPYVGIAIVVLFAGLVTLAADPGQLPWVLGVFLATQQLEGHLILPLVMRGRAQLPAAPLLVFMLVMGSWGGLLGVLIAPALFAVLLLAWREGYLPTVARLGQDVALSKAEERKNPHQNQ